MDPIMYNCFETFIINTVGYATAIRQIFIFKIWSYSVRTKLATQFPHIHFCLIQRSIGCVFSSEKKWFVANFE